MNSGMSNDRFSKPRCLIRLLLVLTTWSIATSTTVLVAQDEPEPKLRLQYWSPNQSMLYVTAEGPADAVAAKQACDALNVRFNSIASLETLPLDCSAYHAIIIGSNGVDFLGWHKDEARKTQVFSSLEQFVAQGGHLLVFGSFNGRNTERLKVFGIRTNHVHHDFFERVPGRTEVLFDGFESVPPSPPKVRSFGNVFVDDDREHVVMLNRRTAIAPENAKAADNPAGSVFVSIAHQRGRVSYSPVEPHAGGPWFVPIVVNWMLRGAPTNSSQLNEDVVVPSSLLRERNYPPTPAFPAEALKRTFKKVRLGFREQLEAPQSLDSKIQLAEQILARSKQAGEGIVPYAQMRIACQLLAAAGEFQRAVAILNDASNQYQFDEREARLQLLDAAMESGTNIPVSDLLKTLISWADDAEEIHQYDNAARFIETAVSIAGAENGAENESDIQAQLTKRQEALQPLAKAQAEIAKDLGESSDAQDSDSKTRLGKFFALTCGDWERGLPLLAEGSDASLRACAELDLQGSDAPAAQIDMAQKWREVPTELTATQRRGTHARALHWYLAALPFVPGSEHQRIVSEISKLELKRLELKFKLQLDGAGRLEISPEGIRWIDHFGVPVSEIQVNQSTWRPEKSPVFLNEGTTSFLPKGITLNRPQLRKLSGRGMVVLQRNTAGIGIVSLNDVPVGGDVYEFIIDAAY